MNRDPTIVRALVGFLILSLVFLIVERALGRGRRQPVFRRGWLTDLIYWVVTPIVTRQVIKFVLLVPALGLVLMKVTTIDALQLRTYSGFGPLRWQPLWLQAVEIYLLVDFIGYWTHRMFHGGRWWPFHAVHHSSEELDWLGSVRVHPVNELVNRLAQVTPLLVLGFNPWVTLSTAPFFTLYAIFLHANVNWDLGPLRSFLASPVFHRWHHSKDRDAWDKNFAGLLPVWDLLFGTYYMPRGRWPENFGIHEPMPRGFFGQLWEPFAWNRRKAGPPPVPPLDHHVSS